MVKLVIRKEQRQAQYYTEVLSENIGLEMTLIPGGTFLMGSPDDEPERNNNESPQHQVTVPSFFLGRYPITQAQWRIVAGWEPVERKLDNNPSRFQEEPTKGSFSRWDRPVENVSWYDAKEFCARLSQKTQKQYRLPTEAEWEYACRAGTKTPFHFGKIITTDYVNYNGNYTYGENPIGEYRKQTTPVGYFQVANAFGLYDMHGNVREWCEDDYHGEWREDKYHASYENAPTDGSAWLSNDISATKILRGGSWRTFPNHCRCANRNNLFPDLRDSYIGLRVVRVIPRILP